MDGDEGEAGAAARRAGEEAAAAGAHPVMQTASRSLTRRTMLGPQACRTAQAQMPVRSSRATGQPTRSSGRLPVRPRGTSPQRELGPRTAMTGAATICTCHYSAIALSQSSHLLQGLSAPVSVRTRTHEQLRRATTSVSHTQPPDSCWPLSQTSAQSRRHKRIASI